MAIFHLSAKVISRSSGRSSVGAAAYRSGERLVNRQSGTVHDFGRKQGIDFRGVLLPAGAPSWMGNRQELWNAVEDSETRVNSRTARELVLALPVELSQREQVELLRGFVQAEMVERGMVADLNLHNSASHNPHAHLLLTTREITPSGFGAKVRAWDKVELLQEWRQTWADHCNATLADSGHVSRVDCRTLTAQGLERAPTRHHGVPSKQRYTQPIQATGHAAINFHNAFLAAMAQPVGCAELERMEQLARTRYTARETRLPGF